MRPRRRKRNFVDSRYKRIGPDDPTIVSVDGEKPRREYNQYEPFPKKNGRQPGEARQR
jgi:hypothetical protein